MDCTRLHLDVYRPCRGILAAVVVAAAGVPASVQGQHLLDRSLQQGSGGINPAGPSFADELRFRNAVVTGNAPGGMSFRGNVGYRAPGEFSSFLGSNSTFAFRRDSVISGMGGMGIRGTDALQYQFALSTGLTPPSGFAGVPSYLSRGGAGATAGTVRTGPVDLRNQEAAVLSPPRWRPEESTAEMQALSLSAMRTPSAFITTRPLQPTILGSGTDEQGVPVGVTASGLRGVTFGPIFPGMQERERTGEEPRPTPAELAGLRPMTDERPGQPALASQFDSPYEEMLDRMRRASAQRPGTRLDEETEAERDAAIAAWRERLTSLRAQLEEPMRGPGQRLSRPLDMRIDPRAPVEEPEPGRLGDPAAGFDVLRGFSPETVDILRRAGQIDALAVTREFDAYGVHMEAGQRHLSTGRFFDAEERFTAALSARPGDPMAAIGRVHAELGAGMFLSAAVNLRDLFIARPEIIGVRYKDDLLPTPQRIEDLKSRLAELIIARPAQARDNGMLLAYLGFQTRDDAAMDRGLSVMSAPAREGEALDPADEQLRRLALLLRQVWKDADDHTK